MGPPTAVGLRARPLALLALLAASPARAYETDQITDRGEALQDVAPSADAEMDRMIAEAVERTNRRTGCQADLDRTKRVLARQIYRVTSRDVMVWRRGLTRAPGFGAYAKWMETAPIDRRPFAHREDIYGELTFFDAVILNLAGPCSTFRVNGVLLGSDKLDHFFDEGFAYWQRSRFGTHPHRGVRYGTNRENSVFGLMTSRAFSYADLKANYDGYRFYLGLLGPGSVVRMGEDGCVYHTRSWDWGQWVDWRYDELLDPSVYVPRVERRVEETLEDHRAEVCADMTTWAPDGLASIRAAHPLESEAPWIGTKAPPRVEPFDLDALCGTDTPKRGASSKE